MATLVHRAASLLSALLLSLLMLLPTPPAQALTLAQARTMASDVDSEARIAALHAALLEAAQAPDPRLQAFIQALAAEQLKTSGTRLLILHADGSAEDALSGAPLSPVPQDLAEVMINNRLRGELDQALAALQLFSAKPAERLAAAQALQQNASEQQLPLLDRALARESDEDVLAELSLARAAALAGSSDPSLRLQAARELGRSNRPATQLLINQRLAEETDPNVKSALAASLRKLESSLAWGERLGELFTGLSLGSILLLVALGLAITYGLMGVINMAHGPY